MRERKVSGGRHEKGKEALAKIGLMLFSLAVIFGVFRLILALSLYFEAAWIYYVGTAVYALAGVAAVVGFFVLNGFSFGREMKTADDLPNEWSEERRAVFLEKQPENKKKAGKLIYVILPLVLTMAVSYVELYIIG